MTNTNDASVKAALLRLGTRTSAPADDLPLPRLLRTPTIALLWATLLVTIVALLAFSRVRLPRVVEAVSVPNAVAP